MAKVTVNAPGVTEAPSATLAKMAQSEVVITDSAGRSIKLVRPNVLAQYRLVRTIGGEAASNGPYVMMLLPLLFVSSIDNDPVFFPSTEGEIEALIQRLDEHGIGAVVAGVQEHFSATDPEAEKAAIKK